MLLPFGALSSISDHSFLGCKLCVIDVASVVDFWMWMVRPQKGSNIDWTL